MTVNAVKELEAMRAALTALEPLDERAAHNAIERG